MFFCDFIQNLGKLLEFRAIDDALIVCTTISPNGQFLTYSTEDEVRFFQLTYEVRNSKHATVFSFCFTTKDRD